MPPSDDDYPFTWSWATRANQAGRQSTEVAFYYQGISCHSVPAYRESESYEAKPGRKAHQGDWHLDGFLRACLPGRDDETAVDWEERVAQLWESASDPENWQTVNVQVDGSALQGRRLMIGHQVFIRVAMAWGDLHICSDQQDLPERLTVQRLPVEELQNLLDDYNARTGH